MQASKSLSSKPRANLGPSRPDLHFEPNGLSPRFADVSKRDCIYTTNRLLILITTSANRGDPLRELLAVRGSRGRCAHVPALGPH